MTTYGAYDAGLPCKNPNCKSHGTPHPNCRCYGDMAAGGEVSQFCSEDRKHQPDCEYFANGTPDAPVGESDEEIDPSQVQMDEPAPEPSPVPTPTPTPEPEGPTEDIDPAQVAMDAPEIPNEEVALDSEKPELSAPDSLGDATQRLATNGLLQEPPKETPSGQLIPKEEWDKLGSNYEDLAKVGLLLTPAGPLGAISKMADAAAAYTGLGKMGATLMSRVLAGTAISGANEVDNWMMGKGDPEHPVGAALAHMGPDVLLSAVFGGAEAIAGKSLKAMAATKVAGKLQSFLAGFASAAQHPEAVAEGVGPASRDLVDASVKAFHDSELAPKGASFAAYKAGQKAFDKGASGVVKAAVKAGSTWIGNAVDGMPGAMMANALSEPLGGMVDSLVKPAARKFVAPVTMKILASGDTQGLLGALGYMEHVAAGEKAVTSGVESMMYGGSSKAARAAVATEAARKKMDKWIQDGGAGQEFQQEIYDQQTPPEAPAFAKGGEVKAPEKSKSDGKAIPHSSGMALHYPDQNMMFHAARGRISNYLTALRPQEHEQKLAFDDAPDDTDKKRSYNKALDMAINPLSVLDEIKHGSLEVEHMKHFNELHPELGSLLKKKLTESITKAQVDGHKPPYVTRQALSMFMGTSLSSELTPASIQAAQNVFAMKKPPEQGQGGDSKPKKGSSSALSKSDQAFLTPNQARQARQGKV